MARIEIVRHKSGEEFLQRAGAWLTEHEVENNLILSVAAQLVKAPREDAYLVSVEANGEVVGCAFRTPPYKLGVTRMPAEAFDALSAHVMDVFENTPAVLGPEESARPIAERIAARQGGTVRRGMAQRVYELTKVVPPANPPAGKMRLAQQADMELIADWLDAFTREISHGPDDVRSYTRAHIANKTVFFWDDDGPKTTALWAGQTPNGVRVGFVYTPPEFRGRGYASAVTAAASQRALDSGFRFCCLYTDLGNPTSNAIYQKIGYQPVADVTDYIIE